MGHHCCSKQKVKRGLWSPEEDEKLIRHITTHGHGCWSSVPKLAGNTLILVLKKRKVYISTFLYLYFPQTSFLCMPNFVFLLYSCTYVFVLKSSFCTTYVFFGILEVGAK